MTFNYTYNYMAVTYQVYILIGIAIWRIVLIAYLKVGFVIFTFVKFLREQKINRYVVNVSMKLPTNKI